LKATITATSRYLPKQIMTNYELEKMVDTSDEWIQSRTGIVERRVVSEGETTSDMCTIIAEELLERSNTDPNEVDVIIIATVTPDMPTPATASLVQNRIGANNAWGFDLSGACTGFIYALDTGSRLIESGKYKKVIVIGSDTMSSILDYTDRNTCVLFGDGGGGVMLERAKDSDSGVIDSILRTDGSGSDYLKIPGGGSLHPASYETVDQHLHYIRQDGQVVFKYAIKGMADISEEILKKNNIDSNSISLYVPHQANKRIIDGAAQRCGFKDDQVYININKYGNTTAGTIPICLDEAKELGRINNGDLILLAAFGAGFTWGSMLIRWGK
jgi:3-oxoacyl-[acyl-carrier-protein] synthase-3|tara:strand:- start:246 stop:1232 length:987 start_codon:yes stop_codon:yes gene_type:complete